MCLFDSAKVAFHREGGVEILVHAAGLGELGGLVREGRNGTPEPVVVERIDTVGHALQHFQR